LAFRRRLGSAGPRADKPKEYEPAGTLPQSRPKCLDFRQSVRRVEMAQLGMNYARMIEEAGHFGWLWSEIMNLSLVDAFGKFGAKPGNRLRAQSAIASDGSLVLTCLYNKFGHPSQGVLRYEGKVVKEGDDATVNAALGQHLTSAREGNLPVRLVVMTSSVDGKGKTTRSFHVRPDLQGKLVSFDGESYVVDFTRASTGE
jgi:hypothetical protein